MASSLARSSTALSAWAIAARVALRWSGMVSLTGATAAASTIVGAASSISIGIPPAAADALDERGDRFVAQRRAVESGAIDQELDRGTPAEIARLTDR